MERQYLGILSGGLSLAAARRRTRKAQRAWRRVQRKRLSYSWSIAASKLEYWSAGVMQLIELSQHSMTPLLHHSMFSLDHPIRPVQNRRRNRQADLLRRFQIDHQLKLCRPLDGEIW